MKKDETTKSTSEVNQEKMGKFIAECRKTRKMTQEDLAEKFGITGQSVSKWENGVNAPDISILLSLSETLGVGVHELLAGERTSFANTDVEKNKINKTIVDSVKFYEKKSRKKYYKITFGLLIMFIVLFVFGFFSIYSLNNYNKVNIYSISSSNTIETNGRIIFNPTSKIFIIDKISYNDPFFGTKREIEATSVKVEIKSNDKTLFEIGDLNILQKSKPLNYYLEEIHIDVEEEIEDEEFGLLKNDTNKLEIVISYKDDDDDVNSISCNLDVKEDFSNNKIFYN